MDLLAEALNTKEWATLAISGGSSPKPMFELFAASGFPWSRVHVFWVDERYVPPNDLQSNFRMANATWLAPAKVPAEIEVYSGAAHGWTVPDSAVYNQAQAERAWSRMLALFSKALA